MKCLDCGMEMEQGTVEGIGQSGGHWYEFTSNEEKKKCGLYLRVSTEDQARERI